MRLLKQPFFLASVFAVALFAENGEDPARTTLAETPSQDTPSLTKTESFDTTSESAGDSQSCATDASVAAPSSIEPAAIISNPVAAEPARADSPVERGLKKIEEFSGAKEQPVAQTSSSSVKPPCVPCEPEPAFHFQLGANYTRARITPHENPTFSGNLAGAQMLFEYRTLNQGYLGAKFAWRQGATHGSSGSRTLLDFDAQDRAGYTFGSIKDHWTVVPFTGFGFRYFREHVPSLIFEYNEFYVPLGVLTNYEVNSYFTIGLDVTWMPQVLPTVLINPLKGARWITTHKLLNVLIEVPFTFNLCSKNHVDLIIKPFFEYWQDGHTTAKTDSGIILGVPSNTYLFGGCDVNLGYSF